MKDSGQVQISLVGLLLFQLRIPNDKSGINYETSKPITVSKAEGFVQTLAAVYQKRCIDFVESILSENQKSENPKKKENNLLILIEKAGAEIISIENHAAYNKNVFFNMNNKSDYKEILKILN